MIKAGFDEYCMWTGGEGGNIELSQNRYWNPYIHTKFEVKFIKINLEKMFLLIS